jgi:hypothetical protein
MVPTPHRIARRLAIIAGLLAIPVCGAFAFAQQEEPLPIVVRTRPVNGYVFDRSSLVVLVRIRAEIKAEVANDEPGSVTTVTEKPSYVTYVRALLLDPLRINERLPNEPDLQNRVLTIEQRDRGDRPLPLKLGHLYVLLISTTPDLLRDWDPKVSQFLSVPPYTLAMAQGGFELVGGKPGPFLEGRRLRVLSKGGPLDAFDGRLYEDLEKELREHR